MFNLKGFLFVSVSAVFLTLSVDAHAQDAVVQDAKQTETKVEVEKAEKPEKIKDRKHPDYMRCRKEPVIGSLSKKRKICMTNKEWKAHYRKGNSRANEFIEENRAGATNGT